MHTVLATHFHYISLRNTSREHFNNKIRWRKKDSHLLDLRNINVISFMWGSSYITYLGVPMRPNYKVI